MDVHEPPSRNRQRQRLVIDADPASVHALPRRSNKRRLRCHDVARNRAQGYARRHRIARLLQPLIAAALLVGLLLERRPGPLFAWSLGKRKPDHDSGSAMSPATSGETDRLSAAFATGGDTGGSGRDVLQPQLRPPSEFLARDLAQIVAFLIRNRGRVDNEVVRMKWAMLDRMSLPLAVYLRDVEAKGSWNELSAELPKAQLETRRRPAGAREPSLLQRRLLGIIPEWSSRGDRLLRILESDKAKSDVEEDDDELDADTVKPTW